MKITFENLIGTLIVVAALAVLAGCATKPPGTASAAMIQPPALPAANVIYLPAALPMAATTNYLTLIWNPNYPLPNTNFETVLIGSANLLPPLTNWPPVFAGATNRCTIAWNFPVGFFSAYNQRME